MESQSLQSSSLTPHKGFYFLTLPYCLVHNLNKVCVRSASQDSLTWTLSDKLRSGSSGQEVETDTILNGFNFRNFMQLTEEDSENPFH